MLTQLLLYLLSNSHMDWKTIIMVWPQVPQWQPAGIYNWTKVICTPEQGITAGVMHQQNVNRSGSHIQPSQTLWSTAPVLLSASRCSEAPLELSNLLSDSTRALSGASSRIFKFWSSWDLCAALRETRCCTLTAVVLQVPYSQGISSIIFIFVSHKIRYILIWHVLSVQVTLDIHIRSICLQTVLERNQRSTWNADWVYVGMHMEAFVARKSVSHHHCHSI